MSIDNSHQIVEEKMEELKQKFEKGRQENINQLKSIETENNTTRFRR